MPENSPLNRIIPLLKKPSLDMDCLQNYRPISNLPLLAKVLERVVTKQLQTYLEEHHLYANVQSAYRRFHSTETALLRVTNDLLRAVDQHHEAVLVLLDLSAAFDTIDHGILLQRLTTRYGITSSALAWFTSYLKGRVQTVNINGTLSEERALRFGAPQGSVIGPILFTMYSAPLQDIITQHGLKCVMYADDTQLYVIFHPSDKNSAMQKLVTCVNDIKVWSTSNKLKFNDSKTEVMFFASRFVPTESVQTVNIGSSPVTPKSDVRNLGVMLDNGFCMTKHVSNVCRSAAMAIYKIGQIRKYLDLKTTERLIHAFVTSRLDYCNCLLYGLPQYELSKLQRIQNSAARLTSRKRDNVESVLQELHWLPIAKRIEFKILLITYKCLPGLAPMYIAELLTKYTPSRNLRSSTLDLLDPPRDVKTCTYGQRSFASAAPKLWNALPHTLRSASTLNQFKTRLKTFLFVK